MLKNRLLRYVLKSLFLMVALLILLRAAWIFVPAQPIAHRTTHYIDMHVHTAGLGYGNSGAFINEEMANSFKFPVYLWAMGVTEEEIEIHGDALVIERIAAAIAESNRVDTAIILAMDGVIDEHGNLDKTRTQIYVPNEFVAAQTSKHNNLAFGASINPYRPDAIERLRKAKKMDAKLVKWIPNIMGIDPSDPAITEFYLEMVKLDLPLLSHTGQERSFAGAQDSYGDPQRLRLPLELGVTVIAAHIATTGTNEGQENFERILPMFAQHPNLFTEISSLTQLNKLNYLAQALNVPNLESRLLYGTDWPLQFFPLVSPLYHLNYIDAYMAKAITKLDNQWDRDVVLKEAMGVPESVFIRTRTVLKMDE